MLRPLEDFVVLSISKEERTTQSGILLSADEKDKPAMAHVLAMGPKVENIHVGDEVIYQTYSGTKVKLEGQDYVIVQAKNIFAVIEK